VDTNKRVELLSLFEEGRYQCSIDFLKSIDEARQDYQASQDIRWQSLNDTMALLGGAIGDLQTQMKAQATELCRRHDQSDAAVVKRQRQTERAADKLKQEILTEIRNTRNEGNVGQPDHGKVKERILHHLHFRQRLDRHEDIPQVHKETFGWLYGDSKSPTTKWANSSEWLCSGSSIY
jgi:hypothetical protein